MVGKKPVKKPFGRDGPRRGYPKDQSGYADPENWRYPLHTPWHARVARRYFDDWSNRSKYTEDERLYIDRRIDEALKSFEKKAGTRATRPIPNPPVGKRIDELSLKKLLRLFLGAASLRRAEEMDESLVSVSEITTDKISGKVKEYTVLTDFNNHIIQHDCEDWRKNMDSKNMCKHLGKFMLSLGAESATRLLRDILKNKEQ